MTFPVYFNVFGLHLHAHPVMEVIAYSGGFQLYVWTRRRWPAARVAVEANLWLIVGCVFGALVGAKVLAWAESPMEYWRERGNIAAWLGGKTIVGGLLGGWAGVELMKKRLRIGHSTGDAFVFPLIFGIAVGRIGCFLTGLADHTHGVATSLPWGVDFGDGVRRHPTQLYESVLLVLLGAALLLRTRRRPTLGNGALFRWFLAGYLALRFGVEFIKPSAKPYAHLSAIQLASLVGIAICLWQLRSVPRGGPTHDAEHAAGRFESATADASTPPAAEHP